MTTLTIMKYGGVRENVRFATALRNAEAQGIRLPCAEAATTGSATASPIAAQLCKRCHVRRECLNAALARNECLDLAGMGLDVGGHLGSQRHRQHLPRPLSGTIASNSDELTAEPLVGFGSLPSWTTLSMGVPSEPTSERRP
jgi:hypothetical protein